MKGFTTVAAVISISLLAVWAIFQTYSASQPQAKDSNSPAKAQTVHMETVKDIGSDKKPTVPVTGSEARMIAPVFDASGAVVADPSGTILNARPSSNRKLAPVFDANGAVMSDPSGTIWGAGNSAAQGTDVKIAPVYDASGRLVSDPTGTIFAFGNP